jgi:hypothetical protein
MKAVMMAICVMALAACGGTERVQSAAEAAETVQDVSGTYTFSQFLFFPFNPADVGQTGQMTVTQTGAALTATAALRYPSPFPASLEEIRKLNKCLHATGYDANGCIGPDMANDVANTTWTGTASTRPDGTTQVQLVQPDGSSFSAQRDASGNLHGACALGSAKIAARCDATR